MFPAEPQSGERAVALDQQRCESEQLQVVAGHQQAIRLRIELRRRGARRVQPVCRQRKYTALAAGRTQLVGVDVPAALVAGADVPERPEVQCGRKIVFDGVNGENCHREFPG